MKITLFIPDLRGGGAERVFLNLAESFTRLGHSVDLVLMLKRGPYLTDVPSNVRLISLECPRLWTSGPGFVRYLRKERPDAVFSSMPLANGIAAWARFVSRFPMRLVLTEHNHKSLVFGDVEAPSHRYLFYFIRPAYRLADDIVAVSNGVADRLRELPGVRPERVHVVHNPVYTPAIEEMAAEQVQHPWFTRGGFPVVLGVGRLSEQKDFATLICAFERVRRERPVRLVILGEGQQERGTLERLVERLGLAADVDMPGFVTNPWAWMARSSVFVLSSRYEGFGNVLVEAMACGTPVVSTNCPSGPAEILAGGRYGTLAPVGDVEALAQGILRTLNHPLPAETLQRRAKEFSSEVAAARYLGLLVGEGP